MGACLGGEWLTFFSRKVREEAGLSCFVRGGLGDLVVHPLLVRSPVQPAATLLHITEVRHLIMQGLWLGAAAPRPT